MAMRWRIPERWTRTTLWWVLAVTALSIAAAGIIGVIWGGDAAFNVSYFWIATMALVLTNDWRPPLNTPRSLPPKARP